MQLGEAAWAEIRRCHEETAETHVSLAKRFGIVASTIAAHVRREGWKARPGKAVTVTVSEPADRPLARPATRKPDRPRVRITRLFRVIDLQLDIMERRMNKGEALTVQDEERQARAFGTIIANLEKATEAAADLSTSSQRQRGKSGADANDAARMRREIAERLERLNAQWAAQGKPEEAE